MHPRTRSAIPAAALFIVTTTAHAQTTYYVNGACGDDAWTGTSATCAQPDGPKLTISGAMNVAISGDTVIIADGLYTGPDNRDIDFEGRAITVRSQNGAETCTIDCELAGRAFIFQSGETRNAVIDGFTITHGYADSGNGGAIDCTLESSPTIMNCSFLDNKAFALGGAVAARGLSLPLISNCTFIGNIAIGYPGGTNGGAIACYVLSDATIIDCTFIGNDARYGGAIDCSVSFPTITNCVFARNTAVFGGAIAFGASDPVITNCTFTRNTASFGGAAILSGLVLPSFPVFQNCILWNNSPNEIEVFIGEPTVNCSTVTGGWIGTGNIAEDPSFADPQATILNLRPGSPCNDAGDNSAVPPGVLTDINGDPRFRDDPNVPNTGLPGHGFNEIVDMGAYEFQPETCYPDCDPSTGPGVLDIFDFLCFQDAFVNADPYACDCDTTTGPGVCDIFDFLCFQDAFVTGCS